MNEVPSGIDHLIFLSEVNRQNKQLAVPILDEHKELLSVLGTALSGIYISSTCQRSCSGGNHIIETLGSRTYNLASGAYSLICTGLYDEALNLVRSIGEIANMLLLAKYNKEKFEEWLSSSRSERIRNFSPAKVRSLIGEENLVMGKEWYSGLCESYTHITPETAPNNYDLEKNACGGIVQKEGSLYAVKQLMFVTAMVSLDLCKYSKLDDIYENLQNSMQLYGKS